jgi:hypothetical protein
MMLSGFLGRINCPLHPSARERVDGAVIRAIIPSCVEQNN